MSLASLKKRLRRFLNPSIKGKFTNALLEAIATGDEFNEQNILAVKEQLFIATATGQFLDRLMSGIGINRPPGVGISDDLFRQIGIQQTSNKLVTNIFLDVLEIFYGADAIRANVLSGRPQGYRITDGMTLIIQVDNNTLPLLVTFRTSDFTNIANASAIEIANVISRTSFNSGYTLTAEAILDAETGLSHVQLMSGTKGPKSVITVLGGSAQNVLRFPEEKQAIAKVGTQFTTSFSGPYVRFTWTAGPSPALAFVNPGDYVNIYGAGYLSSNQGTFTVQNVQDGPMGNAFFEIINPSFVPQGPVTLSQVPGASQHGTVTSTAFLQAAPTGAVRSSNVVTVTTQANHGFSMSQKVTIVGVDNTSFNGTFTITGIPTLNSFTYSQLGVNASSGGGQASVSYVIQPINGAQRSGGISTINLTTTHNLVAGQTVDIEGVDDSSFDGVNTILSVGATSITYTQDASNDVTFFNPARQVIQKLTRYASVYEASPYEIVVFLPATTKIVKRTLQGSWHVHNSASEKTFISAYVYDPTSGFPITKTGTQLTETIFTGQLKTVTFGTNTADFPDGEGFLVFDWGTSNQEGPVKYLGRPSTGSLLLDPSYKFQKTHAAGSDVTLLKDRKPYKPKVDGSDYATYLTGTINGRIEAQKLIETLKAAGIFLNVIIVYPKGPGLHDVEGYVYAGDFV